MTRIPLGFFLTLNACGADKETGDTGPAPDTGEAGALTLTDDDAPRDGDLWTDATWSGQVSSASVTGTIDYEERWDEEEAHCTASMQLSGTAYTGTCGGACEGADWAWQLRATVIDSTGACTFRQPDNAPGLAGAQYTSFFAHFVETDSPYGYMNEMLALGYFSAQGGGSSPLYMDGEDGVSATGWDPSGALDYSSTVGSGLPKLWTVCGASTELEGADGFSIETPGQGTIAASLADRWTLSGLSGQTLRAVVDLPSAGDARLALVDPEGCLVGEAIAEVACSSGETNCPSLTYTLPEDGTWALVISNLSDTSLEYALSASAE